MLHAVPRRAGDLDEPADAAKIGVRDNDWIEAFNRNGVVVARAVVTHRMPEGTVYMYHAKERLVDVPTSRDLRPARRHPQLADPAADQAHPPHRRLRPALLRLQLLRPDRQPARRGHGDPPPLPGGASTDAGHGADGDGDEPRQVHRLPHLLGHLQAGVDQPAGRRVRLVQQRRDPARARATRARTRTRSSGRAAGRWTARPAEAAGRRPAAQAAVASSPTPSCRPIQDYYEPWTYDYEHLLTAPAGEHTRWPGRSRCSPAGT